MSDGTVVPLPGKRLFPRSLDQHTELSWLAEAFLLSGYHAKVLQFGGHIYTLLAQQGLTGPLSTQQGDILLGKSRLLIKLLKI